MANADRDPLAEQLRETRWRFAEKDLPTAQILEQRIAEQARSRGFATYSELVAGVTFYLPAPYTIRTHDWTGFDRALIGDHLGYISMRSYLFAGFLASTVVISAQDNRPSGPFFDWMRKLGAISSMHEDTLNAFWIRHFREAVAWYRAHPSTSALGLTA
jgi:hypothetical protein